MDTMLMKKIGFKVVRKLKVVRAFAPQRRVSDESFLQEIGKANVNSILSDFPQVLPGLADAKSLKRLEKEFSEACERAAEVSQNAVRHRFDLLGSGLIDLGSTIDWCLDFKSGKRWGKRDYRLQKLVNLRDASDVKVPWELSRCNHFLPMAIAYLRTGDDSFAFEFENQVISWCEQNEYLQTVNWSCAMETAIRCINWLLAYKILGAKHRFDEAFTSQLTVELYKGAKSMFENLEKTGDGYNTNHYLSDLLGLLYLGVLFQNADRENNWREFAVSEFEKEIKTQVNPDGLDYESSLPYHGFVTEIFLLAWQLSRHCDFQFSEDFEGRLRAMIKNLARFQNGDGLLENFGDNDDGRILKLFWREARDYRDVLDIGCRLFGMQYSAIAPTPESICFSNSCPQPCLKAITSMSFDSIRLADTGICQLRSKDLVVNFFVNPVGTHGLGNHKHNDLLSLTLSHRGSRILTDPGSFVYTADENLRNEFRSTRNHNTVTVDGQEQNRMVGGLLFLLRSDGTPRILDWISTDDYDLAIAEHDCYARLDNPVTHRRSLYLCKRTQTLVIRDQLMGSAIHSLQFNFHLEHSKAETLQNQLLRIIPTKPESSVLFYLDDAQGGFSLENSWVSPSYGVRLPSIRISNNTESRLPVQRVFAVAPYSEKSVCELQGNVKEICSQLAW